MTVRVALLVTVALLASPHARAADPWTAKPSAEWTLADTTKVLINSPWVKDARVRAPWINGQPGFLFPGLAACGGQIDRDAVPPNTDLGDSFQTIVIYRVSWVSSRAYREARARRSVLCGDAEQDDVESLVEQGAADDFVIHIESPDMTPFQGLGDETIRTSTTLTGKKSGSTTAPTSVLVRKAGSTRVFGVYFHFPKESQDGKPTIVPGETELVLSYKSGKTEIKVRFSPEKMKLGGESDL